MRAAYVAFWTVLRLAELDVFLPSMPHAFESYKGSSDPPLGHRISGWIIAGQTKDRAGSRGQWQGYGKDTKCVC